MRASLRRCLQIRAASTNGSQVDIKFSDGAKYRFHGLWLRDSCRDAQHVNQSSTERVLDHSPVIRAILRTLGERVRVQYVSKPIFVSKYQKDLKSNDSLESS